MATAGKIGVLFRRTWNGPFHIGSLTQPASVGDVLLKVLETFWRLAIAVVLGSLAALCAILTWIVAVQPALFPPLASKIKISVQYDDGTAPIITVGAKPVRCTKEYPLKVTFQNDSAKTVRNVDFSIQANAQARSTDLTVGAGFMHFDGVMKPGYWWVQCYAIAVQQGYDPAILEYRGGASFASD